MNWLDSLLVLIILLKSTTQAFYMTVMQQQRGSEVVKTGGVEQLQVVDKPVATDL